MKEQLLDDNRYSQPPSNRNIRAELHNELFQEVLLNLEGQCKIKQIAYLRINHLKAIFLTTILTLTVVGLLLLKYFKKLRAMVFYDSLSFSQVDQITHVYIKGSQKQEQISHVERIHYQNQARLVFQFQKLRYQLFGQKWLPVGLAYMKDINALTADSYVKAGLNTSQVQERVNLYGKNEHNVEVPTYPEFLFDTMTQPFFLFQYFVSLIYALENVMLFSILMIAFAFITTSINYFLLRKSYNKIKQTAEKRFLVKVFRHQKLQTIQNTELVPGDLFVPSQEIPCDSIVVRGDLFVDQVSLTGETVPIAKFAVTDEKKVNDKSHWLFEGSKLQTMKPNTLALAVNVGYGSRRGRIIRKILTRSMKQPQFFMKIIYFQIQVLIVSVILYLITLPTVLALNVDRELVIIRLGDFITYSFPAPYPIFFNLAYSFCLVRLNKADILGTQPQKTVEGSRVRTMCFDKTGTLTLNKMEVCKVYIPQGPTDFKDITHDSKDQPMIVNCFATCNSVEMINGQVKGDQIDMRLFEFVDSKLQASNKSGVVREIVTKKSVVQVLKINQYESQFQSMSVLTRHTSTDKYYVFVKGNPEMIHKYSSTKFAGFDNFIKKMSFSGYRSIGFGYKEIRPQELSSMLNGTRQQYLIDTKLLGVVTFINQLKDDAHSTIQTLAQAGISTKIITGDNIYLGIQTAFSTGMISNDKKVIVVEGSKYNKSTNQLHCLELVRNQDGTFSEQSKIINNFCYLQNQDTVYAIDNDFITQRGEQFLDNSVKVFARISPQNKALIVKKHKQIEKQALTKRKGLDKLLGDCSYKVGMVGDGANDLIAIKQADVGIGISSSDAIYSASFAVNKLSQIVHILCQSKNSERQINEMAKYYGITQFLSIVLTLIMTSDYSYFTSIELIYKNFFNTLLITLLFGRSKPAKKLTKKIPNSNFLDLENHIVFWGNTIICSLGLIISYVYYQNTDDYEPNSSQQAHFPDGWSSESKTSTINFLAANVIFIILPIFIYQSKPWKKSIWTNKAMLILIILNIIMLAIISYSTQSLQSVTLQPIGKKEISIVMGIMLVTCLLCGVLNTLVQKWSLRRQQSKREFNQEHSLLEY